MKKITSLVIVLSIVMSLVFAVPVRANVSSGTCGDNLIWTLGSNGTLTISGEGDMDDYTFWDFDEYLVKEVIIEDGVTSIGGYAFHEFGNMTDISIPASVSGIGHSAFRECSSLRNITIPDGVESIEQEVFYGCSSLKNVTIPDGVETIGVGAFRGCSSLENINIPDSVESFSSRTFYGCSNLKSIKIPEQMDYISSDTFYGCDSLTTIKIPANVFTIEYGAFTECANLQSITVDENNESYKSIEGVLYNGGWSNDEYSLIQYPRGKTDENFTVPDDVWYIEMDAFYKCNNLKSVTISEGVESIDYGAFAYCENLTDFYVDDGNKYYISDNGVLIDTGFCALIQYPVGKTNTSYTIPNNIITIGTSAFAGEDDLTDIVIPDSVTDIFDSAFNGCTGLDSISLPDGITYIGYNVFYNTGVWNNVSNWENGNVLYIDNCLIRANEELSGDYKILEGTKLMADGAFRNCVDLTGIVISESITNISYDAFHGCESLESVTISDSVTSIEDYAFYYCYNLGDISIPDSVTYIGDGAFEETAMWNDESNWENDTVLYIDNILISANYRNLSGEYSIRNGTRLIANYAFERCNNLTSIIIPESVTIIPEFAFSRCVNLVNVEMPDTITTIEDTAFSNCNIIESIVLPDSIEKIGKRAFRLCEGLKSIVMPKSVKLIELGAFMDCSNLTDVYYTGTEEEWNLIDIRNNNDELLNANIIFNYKPSEVLSASNLVKGTSSVTFDLSVSTEEILTGNIIVSLYKKDGTLPEIVLYPVDSEIKVRLDSANGDYIKVMWLEAGTWIPLSEFLRIDL